MATAKGLFARRYETVHALDGIDFEIESGELTAYIGPNGAGKSTTVKILSGILTPDSGECTVDGRTPWLDRIAHVGRIGAVFGQRTQLWWDLPVIESLDLLRVIYGVGQAAYQTRLNDLTDLLGLSALLDVPARQLSLGQRMRCDLAAALVHSPSILFLDEPTIGLDAPAKLAVRQFIKALNQKDGATVILTTHDLDDAEALCNRALVIANGQIAWDGTLEGLRQRLAPERWLTIDFEHLDGDPALDGAELLERNGLRASFRYDPAKTPTASLIAQAAARYPVADLFVQNPPIEQWIGQIYSADR